MANHFINAIADYRKGAGCIVKNKLWIYTLIPALMGVVFYAMVIALIVFLRLRLYSYFENNFENTFLQLFGWIFAGLFIGLLILYIAFFTFKYAVLVLSAPFMTVLSAKIESCLYPDSEKHQHSTLKFMADLWRSFKLNLRNMLIELLWFIGVLAIGLIFPPAFFLGLLLWLVQAYFLGFGNMDYTMERYFSYREAIYFTGRHKSIALGNGIVFLLLFSIPIIGALIAIPLATAASTVSVLRVVRKN